MKIVILGAGALGTVLGAHLARAGENVTLLARGNRASYLQEHGATLTGLVDFAVPVRVTANQGFYLGEWPAGTSARAQTLADTFARVGIVAQVTPSMQALEWSKC